MLTRLLSAILLLLTVGVAAGQTAPAPVWRRLLPPGVHALPAAAASNSYSVLVSVPIPSQQQVPAAVRVLNGSSVVVEKTLHPGDADLYTLIHGGSAMRIELGGPAAVQVVDLGVAPQLESE